MSIQEILDESKYIAVVGISRDPTKDSHIVSKYMKENGYSIIPVNPNSSEILGENCYTNLLDIPENLQKKIDIINIFRPSSDVMKIVMDALKIKKKIGAIKTIWMQIGISNQDAADEAVKSGLNVVMDSCIMVEHKCLKNIS
ncbi:CoA-binding protein [Candidatus Bathyarchaeota archaeon]|nr:CoA-binding protein [Candidatus Bathyarchaeota archaeon]